MTLRRGLAGPGRGLALLLLALGGASPCRVRAQAPDTLERPPYRVEHWPEQSRLAARLLNVAGWQRALPGLPAAALPGGPVTIVLAPGPEQWDSITGGAAPEWAAGIAVPDEGLVVLPAFSWQRMSNPALYVTLRHELAHVALHRYVAPARVPRWFGEGYARWAAGEWGYDAVWQLRLAFLLRRTPPLAALTLDWPAGAPDARVAYLLSTSAVSHVAELGGERGLPVLFQRWRETRSFDEALRRTLGMTPGQFEESWIASVEDRYAWPVFLTHSVVFWALAGGVLVALFYIRRRRDRQRLARLRATEPPDEPAFWEEDGLDARWAPPDSRQPEHDEDRRPPGNDESVG